MSSSLADLCKSRENQLVSDDFAAKIRSGVELDPGLKLNPVSCFDKEESLPIELLLPDEESLITVDDFRKMPDKENDSMLMLEENPVKAERVSSSSPVDVSRKQASSNDFKDDVVSGLGSSYNSLELHACKSPAQFHQAQSKQGKTSFRPFDSQPAQAHLSPQMKPKICNYNAQKPSSPSRHTSCSNILSPSTFRHSHAKPHQQLQQMLIPGRIPPHQLSGSRYLQELGPTQEFLSIYRYPSNEYFGIPSPGFNVYGSANDLTDLAFNALVDGNERNAGTGFYLGCPHSGNL